MNTCSRALGPAATVRRLRLRSSSSLIVPARDWDRDQDRDRGRDGDGNGNGNGHGNKFGWTVFAGCASRNYITTNAPCRRRVLHSPSSQHMSHDRNRNRNRNHNHNRNFSTITKGQDLLADSLSHGGNGQRKIILDSYYPETGIEVVGMIEYKNDFDLDDIHNHDSGHGGSAPLNDNNVADKFFTNNNSGDGNGNDDDDDKPQGLLMNSSIIAFPNSCFLWKNISHPEDVTLESLSIVQLLDPPIDCLFIGSDAAMPMEELSRIKKEMKRRSNIVVEQMDVMNAMGTFNILNGEDRRVAVALVVDVQNE